MTPAFKLFDPNPRAPVPMPPTGACDSQFHVFAPRDVYPVKPTAVYHTPEATLEAALHMHEVVGVSRGVIVQSTAYGTDSRILEDSLRKAGPNYRGVAIIDESITDADFERLSAAGVIGARFAFVRTLRSAPSLDAFLTLVERCHAHGWLIKVHATGVDLLEIRDALDRIRGPAVLDHISNYHPDGIDHPGADYARQLLQKENWWFMLSNGDRHSTLPFPHPDAIAFARSFIAAAPTRMIWGSDWPHPLIPLDKEMKNDALSLELLYRYCEDEVEIGRILVENPARLFGF